VFRVYITDEVKFSDESQNGVEVTVRRDSFPPNLSREQKRAMIQKHVHGKDVRLDSERVHHVFNSPTDLEIE
jgi:hypothetical protein